MAYFIYNVIIHFCFVLLIPFYLIKILFQSKYRHTAKERTGLFSQDLSAYNSDFIWFHAASVGEVHIAKCLINELDKSGVAYKYIISTSTHSGRKIAREQINHASIFLLPFDLPWIISPLLKKIKPVLSIVVEPDLWPNFIKYARKYSKGVVMVNTWIGQKSIGQYRFIPGLLSEILKNIDVITLTSEEDLKNIKRFSSLDRCKVTGNIKFDQAKLDLKYEEVQLLIKQFNISKDNYVIIAGSTHSNEEEILINTYIKLRKEINELIMIIAPRDIERTDEIRDICKKYNLEVITRTNLIDFDTKSSANIIILDTLGELNKIYSIADIAFVGGTLIDKGGHNLLEPLAFGVPVLFGPYHYNFNSIAKLLIETKTGFEIKTEKELVKIIQNFYFNPEYFKTIKENANNIFNENSGATKKNIEIIKDFLRKNGGK